MSTISLNASTCWVSNNYPTTNYSNGGYLSAGITGLVSSTAPPFSDMGTTRTLLQFDLTALAGATITSATLGMFKFIAMQSDYTEMNLIVREVSTFARTTVNWNTMPSFMDASTYGNIYSEYSIDEGFEHLWLTTKRHLTSLVQRRAGTKLYLAVIEDVGGAMFTDEYYYTSNEPYLSVTYTRGGGATPVVASVINVQADNIGSYFGVERSHIATIYNIDASFGAPVDSISVDFTALGFLSNTTACDAGKIVVTSSGNWTATIKFGTYFTLGAYSGVSGEGPTVTASVNGTTTNRLDTITFSCGTASAQTDLTSYGTNTTVCP